VGNAEDKPKWWKLGTGLESGNLPRLGITVFDQQRLLDNPINKYRNIVACNMQRVINFKSPSLAVVA